MPRFNVGTGAGGGTGGGIPEAPEDGQKYGRQDKSWSPVSEFTDAPSDGSKYGRLDSGWAPLTDLPEAPADGSKYARSNESWSAVVEFPEAPSDGSKYARLNESWSAVIEFPEAPSDGSKYARFNGSWSAIAELPDAPADGSKYARQDESWVTIQDGIGDAPADGTAYGRKDGDWVQLPDFQDAPSDGLKYARQYESWSPIVDLPEAPADGFKYARQNESWTAIQEGIGDAPTDSQVYGRLNGNWTVLANLPDAPSDGNEYVRKDGSWQVIQSGLSDAPNDGLTYGRKDGNWIDLSTEFVVPSDLSGYQLVSQKNQNNGYAGIDAGGKILTSVIPSTVFMTNGVNALTANADAGGFKWTNVGIPTAGTDAATKDYVDQAVASSSLYQGNYTVDSNTPDLSDTSSNANGMMWVAITADPQVGEETIVALPGIPQGTILNNGDRIVWLSNSGVYQIQRSSGITLAEGDSRYLKTVDASSIYLTQSDAASTYATQSTLNDYVKRDGSLAMTAPFNAGGFKLTNVAAGTSNTDGVNKGQLDTAISNAVAGIATPPAEASDASIRAGTGTDYVSARRVLSASKFVTLGSTGTVTIDLASGVNFYINATGNITLANPVSGLDDGRSGLIVIKNNSFSISFGTNWLFQGGIAPDPAPNTKFGIAYIVDPDLNILCTFIENFA